MKCQKKKKEKLKIIKLHGPRKLLNKRLDRASKCRLWNQVSLLFASVLVYVRDYTFVSLLEESAHIIDHRNVFHHIRLSEDYRRAWVVTLIVCFSNWLIKGHRWSDELVDGQCLRQDNSSTRKTKSTQVRNVTILQHNCIQSSSKSLVFGGWHEVWVSRSCEVM